MKSAINRESPEEIVASLEDSLQKIHTALPSFVFLLSAIPLLIYTAWVYLLCWRWFFVPLGVPNISLWHMWGITSLLSTICKGVSMKEAYAPMTWRQLRFLWLVPTVLLVLGSIARLMMRWTAPL